MGKTLSTKVILVQMSLNFIYRPNYIVISIHLNQILLESFRLYRIIFAEVNFIVERTIRKHFIIIFIYN